MKTSDSKRSATQRRRRFPGRPSSTSRISRPHSESPNAEFVERALHREPPAPTDGNIGRSDVSSFHTGFGQYYPTQSLFVSSPELEVDIDPSDGPYAVLGLTRHASWDQIRRAHRSLVSKLHPDRYIGAEDEVMADAERRVPDVNEAFSAIRRQRAGTSLCRCNRAAGTEQPGQASGQASSFEP